MRDSDTSGRDAPLASFEYKFKHSDVELIERRCLHQGFFRLEEVHLRHRLVEGGWSRAMAREVRMRRDAVGVLLYDAGRGSGVLVERIRAGALDEPESPWKWGPVGGWIG